MPPKKRSGWNVVYEPPRVHECPPFPNHSYHIGTVIACDECGQSYSLIDSSFGTPYWEKS